MLNFEQTIYRSEIVFLLNRKIIDDFLIREVLACAPKNKKIALDLKKVESVQSKLFIKALVENKFKLFNINSQVLSYLSIVLKDGFLKSYMSFEDFKSDKRELIKRKFLIAG